MGISKPDGLVPAATLLGSIGFYRLCANICFCGADPSLVMLPLEDSHALAESAYLLRNPAHVRGMLQVPVTPMPAGEQTNPVQGNIGVDRMSG